MFKIKYHKSSAMSQGPKEKNAQQLQAVIAVVNSRINQEDKNRTIVGGTVTAHGYVWVYDILRIFYHSFLYNRHSQLQKNVAQNICPLGICLEAHFLPLSYHALPRCILFSSSMLFPFNSPFALREVKEQRIHKDSRTDRNTSEERTERDRKMVVFCKKGQKHHQIYSAYPPEAEREQRVGEASFRNRSNRILDQGKKPTPHTLF